MKIEKLIEENLSFDYSLFDLVESCAKELDTTEMENVAFCSSKIKFCIDILI